MSNISEILFPFRFLYAIYNIPNTVLIDFVPEISLLTVPSVGAPPGDVCEGHHFPGREGRDVPAEGRLGRLRKGAGEGHLLTARRDHATVVQVVHFGRLLNKHG